MRVRFKGIVLAFILMVFWGATGLSSAIALEEGGAKAVGDPRNSKYLSSVAMDASVAQLCDQMREAIRGFKWNIEPCKGLNWKVGGLSVQGRPIIYSEFGDRDASNTTLVFSMVHGDEITPLYLGIQLAHWMAERSKIESKDQPSVRVVVVPMVNPDGFFRKTRTRTNARKVDLNRNFATADWKIDAQRLWKAKFRADPRRNPGPSPASEPETIFQQELIAEIKPQKILAIHAPLNFLDYDGPNIVSLSAFPEDYVKSCLKLRSQVKAMSHGFFPGSLGNYSGQELGIPTLTLELPSADPRKAERYWQHFKTGIRTMIEFSVPNYVPNYADKKPAPKG